MCIEGSRRKPFDEQLIESILQQIHKRRSKGFRVSRKLIMKKAMVMYDDMVKEGESNEEFKETTGWLRGFMTCSGLLLR